MHAAAITPRGGVAPEPTLLRGQSIIEYVLIIALIGLVIVFAGPGVAGAIRNQFNQVTNTVDSGASGDNFMSAEEKACREAMKTVVNKDAKDWTLDEQKAAATDIAKNGTSSPVYAKAEAAMNVGTKFSIKLTDGKTLEYRIVGINHDDLADGSGKAGLTFEATSNVLGGQKMNATKTSIGGWENSELRSRLNSGDLWSLLPTEFPSRVKSATKMTYNNDGGTADTPSATADKVFLLSATEVYGDLNSDGAQYEYYKFKGVTKSNYSGASSPSGGTYWTRSVPPSSSTNFRFVDGFGNWRNGDMPGADATRTYYVRPAFCF